jgi:hypothetical protein
MSCTDTIAFGRNSFNGSFWNLNVAGTLTGGGGGFPSGTFVVSALPGQGNYTTVSAALAAAAAAIVAQPGLVVDIIVYPGLYIENINLVAGANIIGTDQAPAVVGSSYIPASIIQGVVTDVGVPDESNISLVGLTFQDNNDVNVFVLNHAWCIMNNCVVQTIQGVASSNCFFLRGLSFVQFQSCSVTSNFSVPNGLAADCGDTAGIYYYYSNIFGGTALSGSGYCLGSYSTFTSLQSVIQMASATSFFESAYNTFEAGTSSISLTAAGSIQSVNDFFTNTVGFAVVAFGPGIGTTVSITNPTFGPGSGGISPSVTYAPLQVGFPNYSSAVIATATAGGAGALPATPAGYLPVRLQGVTFRIPLYLP